MNFLNLAMGGLAAAQSGGLIQALLGQPGGEVNDPFGAVRKKKLEQMRAPNRPGPFSLANDLLNSNGNMY